MEAEVNDVVIEWTCPYCSKENGDMGLNVFRSDSCMGKIIDKCEDCGKEYQLN